MGSWSPGGEGLGACSGDCEEPMQDLCAHIRNRMCSFIPPCKCCNECLLK